MEVILLEKINKLGDIGEIVKVKPGYARNFLIPNKIAIRATKENKEIFEKQKDQLKKANIEKKQDAEKLLPQIPETIDIFREASEQGALFGSVTSRDIANELNSKPNLNIKAKDILIKQVIKSIGSYTVNLVLHPEVIKSINIKVQTSEK
tara:strand:+ start:262 stop:711 length:450 start_codon:yes stop_codon:yes gene_type:complete